MTRAAAPAVQTVALAAACAAALSLAACRSGPVPGPVPGPHPGPNPVRDTPKAADEAAALDPGPASPTTRVAEERALMGTTFRIVVDCDGVTQEVRDALEAAFAAVRTVEDWASDWSAESEARQVTARAERVAPGTPIALSSALWEHLAFALDVAARTEGAFDPTLGTLTRLWRRSARLGELPSPARLAEARAVAGYAHVALDPARPALSFDAPGVRLDLGGSAKGEALDRAFEVLSSRGFSRVLIDGGGDLRLGAPPRGEPGWRVELAPLGPGAGALRFTAAHCAIATSGDAQQSFALDGVRYGHILDPMTGLGLTARRAATVFAPDGRTADALATALVVRGAEGSALFGPTGPFPEAAGAVFEPGKFPACVTEGFPQDGGHVEGARHAEQTEPRAPMNLR
ncbi:MAG: FAD:protein FMN transferase [Planctomycetota bacterium]